MSIRVVTMTGEVKYQGDVGPRGPQGIQGEKGDKPIKGIDYFTDADRNSMIEEVIKDSTNEFNVNVENKTKDFNANSTEKTNTFNSNAESKTDEFNSNVGTLIATYNSNHSSKMAEYNTNSNTKTTEYNNNATQKIGAYNTNDAQKTSAYNLNAEQKTTAFNENYTEKLNTINKAEDIALDNINSEVADFNSNAEEKLNSFNLNSANKLNEFNENTTTKTNEFNTNATNKTDDFNANYEEKLGLFNEDANIQRISNLEIELATQLDKVEQLNQDLNGTAVNSEELIGENLTLTDSANKVRFAKFILQGNSVQSEEVPTSAVPSEIKNVTSVNGKITSKNLFNYLWFDDFSKEKEWTAYVNALGTNAKVIPINIGKGRSATFSSDVPSSNSNLLYAINDITVTANTYFCKDKSTTIEADVNGYVYIGYIKTRENYDMVKDGTYYIQIEEGTVATEYEPYQEQTFTFPLLENQKLYQDSYLAENGIHQMKNAIRLDESQNWNWYNSGSADNDEVIQFSATFAGFTFASNQIKCNYFKTLNGKDNSTYGEGIYLHPTLGVFYIRIKKSELTTQDKEGFKAWLAEHNVIVEYTLAEEEIIPYAAEQEQAYDLLKKLYTYKGTTHVFFDDEVSPKADVIYRKDIETLINNLQTAIVALGGET